MGSEQTTVLLHLCHRPPHHCISCEAYLCHRLPQHCMFLGGLCYAKMLHSIAFHFAFLRGLSRSSSSLPIYLFCVRVMPRRSFSLLAHSFGHMLFRRHRLRCVTYVLRMCYAADFDYDALHTCCWMGIRPPTTSVVGSAKGFRFTLVVWSGCEVEQDSNYVSALSILPLPLSLALCHRPHAVPRPRPATCLAFARPCSCLCARRAS